MTNMISQRERDSGLKLDADDGVDVEDFAAAEILLRQDGVVATESIGSPIF